MSIGNAVLLGLLFFYSPAILLIMIGIGARLKGKHKLASKLFIAAVVYFIISTGICQVLIRN